MSDPMNHTYKGNQLLCGLKPKLQYIIFIKKNTKTTPLSLLQTCNKNRNKSNAHTCGL